MKLRSKYSLKQIIKSEKVWRRAAKLRRLLLWSFLNLPQARSAPQKLVARLTDLGYRKFAKKCLNTWLAIPFFSYYVISWG